MRDALVITIAIFFAMEGVVGLILALPMYRDYRREKRDDKRVVEEIIRMCRESAE